MNVPTKRVPKSRMRVGDLLTFKAATRASFRTVTRKIRDFDPFGRPLVGYEGWPDFIVQPGEIKMVHRPLEAH